MRRFAVAFTTTGNSPKNGHRFSEIVVAGDENGVASGEGLSFRLPDGDETMDSVTFEAALEAMKSLVGDSPIVVHDAGKWRRFLRAELRTIKRHGAANLMNNVVDVSAWAHQRYPRQRKDVTAIARRADIVIPNDLNGLALDAELLRRIGNLISEQAGTTLRIRPVTDYGTSSDICGVQIPPGVNWVERIGCFWRTLVGKG